ncbi:hypothetical protein AVEN_189083-1 [Araneus ventricosus]|uniref:Uncharacterized protein n=1 Tax=Araneus ventricosus TaxID=182803 RepID=A0A4Y2MEJ3_ARAVE|nr:hypothetical protein AVEN_189083-1 [Araneus ventricosus]
MGPKSTYLDLHLSINLIIVTITLRQLWTRGKMSASKPEGSSFEPRFLSRSFVHVVLLHDKSYIWAKPPPADVVQKFEEGVPAHLTAVQNYY